MAISGIVGTRMHGGGIMMIGTTAGDSPLYQYQRLFRANPNGAPLAYANDNNADAATYSPIGRLVYGEASIRF